MNSKILATIVSISVILLITISCLAKESSSSGIKVLTFEPSKGASTMQYPAHMDWRAAFNTKIISLDAAQEKRLIEGINKLISMVDNISPETNKHKVDSIELNIGVDVNADAVLVNVGSNESIKVILTRK